MATKVSGAGHVYLYAIVPATEKEEGQKDLGIKGLYDSNVFAITHDGVAAVVSEVPATDKLRPERKHLAAHQAVLSHLIEKGGVVLPVSFGTVADSPNSIREMLKKYEKTFRDQIRKVSGKVEMELRVMYEVPNVFEYFVSKYPELKAERDELYKGNGEPSREEKIELGQHFEAIQSEDREKLTTKVEDKLGSACSEIKRNRPRNEKEVMRVSCLIDKADTGKFQSALDEASDLFDDNFVFEFNGPLPPYNFVDVRVHV